MNKIVTIIFLSVMSISLNAQSNIQAVRGVWLTNVDSEVLNSRENIVEAVNLLDELGFNSIFVVTWNKAMTSYPSKIMKDLTGVEIDTLFTGRDPLKELIDEAHSKKIKVIAWFEFGFSSSYQEDGGNILKNKPEWASRTKDGELVQKNGFEWMNGFNPDVQEFMLSLIMEVVENYDIDGIQGDDRLPAMPSEAGYEEYTMELYREQHRGKNPPKYEKDYSWIKWRSGLLNKFMNRIYTSVKEVKPDIIVSMAPSIYPWSEEEYLQDWPTWVNRGWVELILPQLYRYDIKSYRKELNLVYSEQVGKDELKKFYPGVLLKVGEYYPTEKFLREMISSNRELGIEGEVFFFYEGVKKYKDLFIELYNQKADFPELIN
jgi:uncharacterized lipoprotein YddW (UPF0748 family)